MFQHEKAHQCEISLSQIKNFVCLKGFLILVLSRINYIIVIYAYSYISIYPSISSRSAQTVKYINNVNFVSISGILPVEWSVRLIQHLQSHQLTRYFRCLQLIEQRFQFHLVVLSKLTLIQSKMYLAALQVFHLLSWRLILMKLEINQ